MKNQKNKIFSIKKAIFLKQNINRSRYIIKGFSVFLMSIILLSCIEPAVSAKADNLPRLRYPSKVLYIGNDASNKFTDKLNKYTDNCWTPSSNNAGWTVNYSISEGADLVTVAKNGKITAIGAGIGSAKVNVTYSKKGESDITDIFTIKVRRNAAHVRLTDQSSAALEATLGAPLVVGEVIYLNAAKSYDGSYKQGHYGLNNYMGVVSDNLRIESLTPGIVEADGLTITAKASGTGKLIVKAYQYSDNRFTGIQSQVYTIKIKEDDMPEADITPEPTAIPTIIPEQSELEKEYSIRAAELVNEEREKEGLPSLILDADVSKAALIRTIEIIEDFNHERPGGLNFSTVFAEVGISVKGAGENIAYGQKTPEDVIKAWMDSEGHRRNILNEKYTSIGIGVYEVEGKIYWVQLFIYKE